MKKEYLPYILFGMIAVLLLLYFTFTGDDQRRYMWNESYDVRSDQPYGTLFIRKLLEKENENGSLTVNMSKPLHQMFNEKSIKPGTDYYFIGQSLYLDKEDRNELLKHIAAGNNAFISSLDPPDELIGDLHIDYCDARISYTGSREESAAMNFYYDSLKDVAGYRYSYRYGSEDRPYAWTHIPADVICSQSILVPLGYHGVEQINFVRIPLGEGNIYLHCNPIVFTNYFISKEQNTKYIATVFSHLTGNNILWDEHSKMPYSMNKNSSSSPLYYILEQPGLKYAWYLMLFTVLLYVLFTLKRTQRIIPVLEEKSNTSLAFVQLISTLHFQNANHLDMARKKMRYFLFFIRSRYGIHAHTLTEEHVDNLAERSGVERNTISTVLKLYQSIDHNTTYSIDAFMLMNFYQAVEKFYKNCK